MAKDAKIVTLQDIADQVGVHKSTVQRALVEDPRVDPRTAERIRAVAAKLQYDPDANLAARRLSLRKTGRTAPNRLIALFFPPSFAHGNYFSRQLWSMLEVLTVENYDLLARFNGHFEQRSLPPPVLRGDVDATVMLAHPETLARQQAKLAALPDYVRRPLISMINPMPGLWSVTADFRQGGRLLMEHLLDLGHRRFIAFGAMSYQSEERVAGYRDALAARGLDPARQLAVADVENTIKDWRARVADTLDRLLAAKPDATAVLAPNDPAAVAVIELLAERGRRVPDDISVAGFDDTDPLPGPDQENRLTSVALPLEQMGAETARMAINPGEDPRTVVLPVGLRVRATTRPPRV